MSGYTSLIALGVYLVVRGNHEWQIIPDLIAAAALAVILARNAIALKNRVTSR